MKDRLRASRESMAWTLAFRQPEDRTPTHWLRGDARGRYDGIREKLAAGVMTKKRAAAPRSSHLFLRIKCRQRFSRCLGR
jgi:hypothetical protein